MRWLALSWAAVGATTLAAQAPTGQLGARAVVAWYSTDPVAGGGRERLLRITQPTLMARGRWRWLEGHLAVSLEGLTLEHGEPAPGDWGEGFVDRRHPHTYLHEAILATVRGRFGLFAGKGFAPFGSDDPMSRPFLRFPINHHLAQILERAVIGGQVRLGPGRLEAAVFNGDEPERPGGWPNLHRFGDSWSIRTTASPARGLDLSGSVARVTSPEHRPGAGSIQRKAHLAARVDRSFGTARGSGLAEWARTSELDGFFVFHSGLAEAALERGRVAIRYRFERTERPEEERVGPFRSLRPHLENSILGITRWVVHTAGTTIRLTSAGRPFRLDGLVEASRGRVASVGGGLFDPTGTYGRDTFWAVTLGIKLGWRDERHQMGHYGLAIAGGHPH
jgi:hypothetical protein